MTWGGENSPPGSQESPGYPCRFVTGRNDLVCVKQELMEPSLRMLWGSEKSWALYCFWLFKILCSFPKAPSCSCSPLYILSDHHRHETAINPSSFYSPTPSLSNSLWSREKVTTPLRMKSQSSAVLFEIANLLSFALSGNPLCPLDLSHTHDAALWKGSGETLHSSGRMIWVCI